jgi:class 3 adenylate cyclase
MNSGPFRRYLAALISADVVGYSRLISDDEIGTIRALTACHNKIAEVVKKSGGRLVDFVGDNMLAEFSNTLDAVQCADHIHHALENLNRSCPKHRHLEVMILITAIHVAVGDRDRARETAKMIRNVHPGFSLETFSANHPYKDQKYLDQIIANLSKVDLLTH